jgi:hypothetical protein
MVSPTSVRRTFAVDGAGRIVIGIENKPRAGQPPSLGEYRREPRVSLLVDQYADDWNQLW